MVCGNCWTGMVFAHCYWRQGVVTGDKVFITTVITDGKSKPPQRGMDFSNEYIAKLMKEGLSEQEAIARVTARDIELPEEVTLHYSLVCLDLKSGDEIWKREFHSGRPPGGRHRKNSFASETPVTDGTLVYVYTTNLGVFAYDLDGRQKWQTPLKSHPVFLDWGTGGSPVLHDDQLLIVNDNQEHSFVASLNKETGKQIWKTRRDSPNGGGARAPASGWVTPFVWRHKARSEIVTIGPGTAISYSLDGKELWRLNGMSESPVPTPFAYKGRLYVNGGKTRPVFAVNPGGAGDITPKSGDGSGEQGDCTVSHLLNSTFSR
ncbi:PQQ-binding-like beta-propeller repeat protein [Planctomycetota bacterium]